MIQKRLLFLMLLFIGLIFNAVPINTFANPQKTAHISEKLNHTFYDFSTFLDQVSFDEDESEDDETETLKLAKPFLGEESELEHKELIFAFFPPKKIMGEFAPNYHPQPIFSAPFSPPDFCA